MQSSTTLRPTGTAYWLPTGRISAQLVYQPSRGFALRMALLPLMPDVDKGLFYLNYQGSPVENDKVQVEVEDGLLKTVSIASETKLLDTVQGAGEGIGAIAAVLETALSRDQVDTLVTVRFNPANPTEVQNASKRLTTGLRVYAKREITLEALQAKPKATDKAALAELALRAALLHEALNADISLAGTFPAIPTGDADCKIGICYRPLRPGLIDVSVNGVTFTQLGMNIPNGAPAVAFELSRSGAANSGQVLALDHGVLTSATITKDAEAPNIVRIPGTLIAGVIKGLTDTLTAKKGELGAKADVVNAQAALADARGKLLTSQAALAAKRAGGTSLEASIDDGGAGDLWLPGLSYLRTPTQDTTTQPAVGQTPLQPTKGSKAGAGQGGQAGAGQGRAGQGSQAGGGQGGQPGQPGVPDQAAPQSAPTQPAGKDKKAT
ncbi:hypothetical protein SCH01S_49_00130 [Sphingomonas changbaiensis NBRC 104936]|uniref:Uncharacterized protein n=2 Tax=Sphingomonas changbaiensis TaxID=529705 RepID=A0A0E9MSQ2_9SPHN|nr:hypothetical protein SCH01S_49_00130 [Sphingomonas changbaiensis NBRC 104936]